MGIVARERFIQLYKEAPQAKDEFTASLRQSVANALGVGRPMWLNSNDDASLSAVYDQLRDFLKQHGYFHGKILRPWLIDKEFDKNLDRKQVWWGFEFETGYVSREARGQVIHYTWDNFDGVCFDAEGEGNAAVEITFGPQEMSKFADRSAQAYRFIEFLDANPGLIQKGDNPNVGTHLNISAPGMTAANIGTIGHSMNRTVGNLPMTVTGHGNVRMKMFGRQRLYAGFFVQNQGGKQWLEGKLFRTTYQLAAFQNYIKTANAISRALVAVMGALESKDELADAQRTLKAYPYVDNLWEMYRDETVEPVVMWSKTPISDRDSVNGPCSKEGHPEKHPQTLNEIRAEVEKKKREEQERQRKLEEAKRIEALEAELRVIHTKLFKAGKTPKGLPKGYTYCPDCEVFHDDDQVLWEGKE